MTPILRPTNHEERLYNRVHKTTRCSIERSFGCLKSRWRILDHTGGTLCYSPAKSAKIIVACCILHNICRRNGTEIIEDTNSIAPSLLDIQQDELNSSTTGNDTRSRLIRFISSNQNNS